jgi:hypothetical protein
MKTIPLTENEINHIKEMYAQELERLQKRASEISSMLKKLQGKMEAIEEKPIKKVEKAAVKAAKPAKRKYARKNAETPVTVEKKVKTIEEKPKAKRGRPAKKVEVKAGAKAEVKSEKKTGKKIKIAGKKTEKTAKTQITSKVENITKAKKGRPAKAKKGKPAKAQKASKAKNTVKVTKTAKTKKGRPAKAARTKAASIAVKGKRGRKKSESSKKSRWTTTIIDLLENQKKVLSSRAIVDEVMKRQNIPATEYSKTRSIVAGSLSDLVLETKRLKTVPIPGQKGKLYGLAQWFDEKGNLTDKSKL